MTDFFNLLDHSEWVLFLLVVMIGVGLGLFFVSLTDE